MALTRAQHAQRRLKEITKAHESTHMAVHNDFKRVLLRVCARHGAQPIAQLSDWFSLPSAVHEDPEIIEARQAFHVSMRLAGEAKVSSVASLPKVKYRRG